MPVCGPGVGHTVGLFTTWVWPRPVNAYSMNLPHMPSAEEGKRRLRLPTTFPPEATLPCWPYCAGSRIRQPSIQLQLFFTQIRMVGMVARARVNHWQLSGVNLAPPMSPATHILLVHEMLRARSAGKIFGCRAFQAYRIDLFWETRWTRKWPTHACSLKFTKHLLFSTSISNHFSLSVSTRYGCRSLLKDAICTGHSQALDAAFQPVSRRQLCRLSYRLLEIRVGHQAWMPRCWQVYAFRMPLGNSAFSWDLCYDISASHPGPQAIILAGKWNEVQRYSWHRLRPFRNFGHVEIFSFRFEWLFLI